MACTRVDGAGRDCGKLELACLLLLHFLFSVFRVVVLDRVLVLALDIVSVSVSVSVSVIVRYFCYCY